MKKIMISVLVILLLALFVSIGIYINQEPGKEQTPLSPESAKEQPWTADDLKSGQLTSKDAAQKEKSDIAKDKKKEKLPASKDIKKETPTVPGAGKKEAIPVPAVITEEPQSVTPEKKAPVVKEKSAKEISRLQEKCENSCKRIFRKEYNNGVVEKDKSVFLYLYKSHYNKKLDKCFMMITEDGVLERYKKLLDVNENNSYGSVRLNNEGQNLGCYVLNKQCKSEEGWDSLVKPYMEE